MSRDAYKINVPNVTSAFLRKVALNSSITNRFYRGSESGLGGLRESKFPQGIYRVFSIAKVLRGMLTNIMGVQ